MITIRIVLDTPLITEDETREFGQGVHQWLTDFLKSEGKPPWIVEVGKTPGALGTVNVYLTDKGMESSALGYHKQENGYPAAWISPTACGVAYEYPAAPKELWTIIRLNALFGIYIPIQGQPPMVIPGLASVLAHEIQELIVDPDPMGTLSSPTNDSRQWATDKNGKKWLKEVGDHANSGHFVLNVSTRLRQSWKKGWRVVISNRLMVFSDATLESFYRLDGKTPFTFAQLLLNLKKVVAAIPAPIRFPFDWTTGAYGWEEDSTGSGKMAYFARPDDSPAQTITEG